MIVEQAEALIGERRFCEYLDARLSTSRSNSWPHNRTTALRWVLEECELERLRDLAHDPEAAAAFGQIAQRFAEWDRNGELEV